MEGLFGSIAYFYSMEPLIVVRDRTEKPTLYITMAELAVIREIAEGKTSLEIAAERSVSPKTVETQRNRLLKRLECKNTAHLIMKLCREKILL